MRHSLVGRNTVVSILTACFCAILSLEFAYAQPAPLYLVAQLGPDVKSTELKEKFQNAIKQEKTIKCDLDNITVKDIDAAQYNFITQLIQQRPGGTRLSGDVSFMVDERSATAWVLSFGNQNLDLQDITIKGKRDGKNEELKYEGDEIGGVGDTSSPVRVRIPGYYYVDLPKGFEAQEYEATLVDVTDPAKEEKVKGPWPTRGQYCLIEIPQFEGDRTKLKTTLEDPKKIGEPITLSDVRESISLFHAFIGNVDPGDVINFDRNLVSMQVSCPENRYPKRVWMAFPLTEEEANRMMAEFREANGEWKKGRYISKMIAASKPVRLPEDWRKGPNTFPVYEVRPNNKTKWHELPPLGADENQRFGAAWKFVDAQDWKAVERPRDWRIYVFEFEYNDGTTEVVSVIHPHDRSSVRAIDEKTNIWAPFISQLKP